MKKSFFRHYLSLTHWYYLIRYESWIKYYLLVYTISRKRNLETWSEYRSIENQCLLHDISKSSTLNCILLVNMFTVGDASTITVWSGSTTCSFADAVSAKPLTTSASRKYDFWNYSFIWCYENIWSILFYIFIHTTLIKTTLRIDTYAARLSPRRCVDLI